VANAFFVAAEFALARVRPTALEASARAGEAGAERALAITKQLDAYLTATQLGITLASLGLGWLGEPALAHFIQPPLSSAGLSEAAVHGVATVVAFSVISLLHIVVGELVPKSLAILEPEKVSRLTARPMGWFYVGMYPALYVLNGLSNYLLRLAGVGEVNEVSAKLTAEEIRLIVEASFGDDEGETTKRELLERVLRATDRPARALMVPRVDMVTLSLADTLEDWLAAVRKSGFSRYPVTEDGNADHLAGYVYVKDLLLAEDAPRRGLRALTRDLLFVPESLSVGDVLTRFQASHIPIAIVVDEYGGTSGLVTVEDVVEELVGEIQDELDVETPPIQTREDGTVIADGKVALGDLPIEGLQLDAKSAADTLSGYILDELGRLAHPGDRLQLGSYEATVEDVRRRRIARVALRPHKPTEPPPPE
jgi:CBS domain containing-hemolysin-like protein